jgi:nucleoside-diphosphate-sugar epimerase
MQIWSPLSGKGIVDHMPINDSLIHVRDVARVLLWSAGNPQTADGERYLCASGSANGQAVVDILNKHLPELNLAKGNPGEGYEPDYVAKSGTRFDGSKAAKATGQSWIPYETCVLETAQYLQQYLD